MPYVVVGLIFWFLVYFFWDAIISFLGALFAFVLSIVGIVVVVGAVFYIWVWSAGRNYIKSRHDELLVIAQENGVFSQSAFSHTQTLSENKSPWYLEYSSADTSPLFSVEDNIQITFDIAIKLLSFLRSLDKPTRKDAKKIEESIRAITADGNLIQESIDNLPDYLGDDLKIVVTRQVQKMISELKEQLDRINTHLDQLAESETKREIELKRENDLKEESLRVENQNADNESRQLAVHEVEADAKQRQLTQDRQQEEQRSKEKNEKLMLQKQEEQRQQDQLKLEAEEVAAIKARAKADQIALKEAKKASDIPLPYFLDFLKGKFKSLTDEEVSGENHSKLLDAYSAMNAFFKEKGLVNPEQLVEVASDVKRINQIETVMDLYGEKLRRVKRDESLDEEERQMKMEYWIRLRDRDVSALEE